MNEVNGKIRLLAAFLLCAVGAAWAKEPTLSAQMEASLMKALLGEWQIQDSSLGTDGQWQAGPGADWHFYPILNGHAVQDDWISPPLRQPAPASGRQFGTNIRIFNPAENRWEMAWASVKGQQVDTFMATETAESIIMTGEFNGQNSRITFYDIQPERFSWKLEYETAPAVWTEVYRIQGTRAPAEPVTAD
ncbi:hypothetical protein [Marinicella meishanensis]|uniref:hypothetical protein n=1 Tax=Marinicella meishanensis TaxID=2873263 RepID=UPI001CBD4F28|nr:hypothetical protein [Marinicella sp. NBU2979]